MKFDQGFNAIAVRLPEKGKPQREWIAKHRFNSQESLGRFDKSFQTSHANAVGWILSTSLETKMKNHGMKEKNKTASEKEKKPWQCFRPFDFAGSSLRWQAGERAKVSSTKPTRLGRWILEGRNRSASSPLPTSENDVFRGRTADRCGPTIFIPGIFKDRHSACQWTVRRRTWTKEERQECAWFRLFFSGLSAYRSVNHLVRRTTRQ